MTSSLGVCLRGHEYDFERVTKAGKRYKVCLRCRRVHSKKWLMRNQTWATGSPGRRVGERLSGQALEDLIFEIGVPGVAERFGVSIRTVHGWRAETEEERGKRAAFNWSQYPPDMQVSLIRSQGVSSIDATNPPGWDAELHPEAKRLVEEQRNALKGELDV